MKKTVIIIYICALCACQAETEQKAANTQMQDIDSYINRQLADTSLHATLVVNNNTYRLIYTSGTAPTAGRGDSVYFSYIGYIFASNRKTPFDTNRDTLGFTPIHNNGIGIVGVGHYIAGLDNGLSGMQTGEKAEILFPASEGYGNTTVGTVPPLSALLFEVEMTKVVMNDEQ
ncbi:MAG: FKBP-type peptidyl-prolyl cis-trans isomerase [Prevotellaceae bacterium]|jgi:FKBP-type peptidyl-prolyl cis-trans isomerase|nr:FKBP-type peptidyl-prolyl cis-trans isomerase [Prevotellaceae bacterium]